VVHIWQAQIREIVLGLKQRRLHDSSQPRLRSGLEVSALIEKDVPLPIKFVSDSEELAAPIQRAQRLFFDDGNELHASVPRLPWLEPNLKFQFRVTVLHRRIRVLDTHN